MFTVFNDVKRYITTTGYRKPCVTSSVIQTLKLTMLVTLLSCVLVTARQYIGSNIYCLTGYIGQIHQAVENYCFISGTFTVPGLSDQESAHPGVGPLPINIRPYQRRDDTGQIILHSYYQWVPIVLALQALLYYLPEVIWNQIDRGYFETTICKLNEVHINEESADDHIAASASYMAKTLRQHSRYAISFFIAEAVALVIAISNLFFTNVFLGGAFFDYGVNAVRYLNSPVYDYNNPLNQVFPKMGKCTWYKYGPSGSVEKYDAMCVLPLNIVNEKTYILLWFTFILAACISGIFFIWHSILFAMPSVRNSYLLRLPMRPATRERIEIILRKGNLGDWFLVWNYKPNMMYFGEWAKKVNEMIAE